MRNDDIPELDMRKQLPELPPEMLKELAEMRGAGTARAARKAAAEVMRIEKQAQTMDYAADKLQSIDRSVIILLMYAEKAGCSSRKRYELRKRWESLRDYAEKRVN